MAGRVLNRQQLLELGKTVKPAAPDAPGAVAMPRKRKAKAPAATRVRKTRAKKAPPRMRARWGVFDGGMKQVAIFDYNQRAAADDKVEHLRAKNKGLYFLQIVKEPMPELAEVPPLA